MVVVVEEQLEMGLAVEGSVHGREVGEVEGGVAVAAAEAGLVEGGAIGQAQLLVHHVHRLRARLALHSGCCCHFFLLSLFNFLLSFALSRIPRSTRENESLRSNSN